jgi:hypothetical protein
MASGRIGQRGDTHMATTVTRVSRVISGEGPSCRPADPQTEAAYPWRPLGVQLPWRLTEKVSQESVTAEPNDSCQDDHCAAEYDGNGNKRRGERHDTDRFLRRPNSASREANARKSDRFPGPLTLLRCASSASLSALSANSAGSTNVAQSTISPSSRSSFVVNLAWTGPRRPIT